MAPPTLRSSRLQDFKRIGLTAVAAKVLELDEMLPAVTQGTIGIETRDDDAKIRSLLAPINHPTRRLR